MKIAIIKQNFECGRLFKIMSTEPPLMDGNSIRPIYDKLTATAQKW